MVLRRRIRDKDGLIAIASEAVQQLSFLDEADNPIKLYEHVVLVTSFGREGYELRTIAQLYRDRGAMRTALMRSRTSGDGRALPVRNSNARLSWRAISR